MKYFIYSLIVASVVGQSAGPPDASPTFPPVSDPTTTPLNKTTTVGTTTTEVTSTEQITTRLSSEGTSGIPTESTTAEPVEEEGSSDLGAILGGVFGGLGSLAGLIAGAYRFYLKVQAAKKALQDINGEFNVIAWQDMINLRNLSGSSNNSQTSETVLFDRELDNEEEIVYDQGDVFYTTIEMSSVTTAETQV